MFGPYKFVDQLASAINEFEKAVEMNCFCNELTLHVNGCMCDKGHRLTVAKQTINSLLKQTKRKKGKKDGNGHQR